MNMKKYTFILLLTLIVGLCAVSFVSASDVNATDDLSAVDSDAGDISAVDTGNDDSDLDEVSAAESDGEIESDVVSSVDSDIIQADESSNTLKKVDDDSVLADGNDDVTNASIALSQSGKYYKSKTLKVKVTDKNKKTGINKVKVKISFSNGKTKTLTTNSKGIATWKMSFAPGKYKATATIPDKSYNATSAKLTNIKIAKAPVTIKTSKFTARYRVGKIFKVKVIDKKTKKALTKKVTLKLKVYTGKKSKTYTLKTNSKGIAKIKVASLSAGKHKVIVSLSSKLYSAKKTKSYLKVLPRVIKLAAINTVVKHKTYKVPVASLFMAQVKDKILNRYLNGLKLKVKIYTGKKVSKSLTLKTGKVYKYPGSILYLTNHGLSIGTHKVVITSGDKNYKGAVKTKLVMKKTFKYFVKTTQIISNGKTYTYKS